MPPPIAKKTRAAVESDDERKEREEKEREDNKKETGYAETDEERKKREDDERDGNADGDDDSDQDDEKDPYLRRARARERGRITSIMISDAAERQPVLAMHISATTNMPRSRAIKFILELGALAGDQTSSAKSLADKIILAGRRARGEVETPFESPVQSARGRPDPNLHKLIIAAGKKRRGEA
jgi:hypothetical protein